MGGTSGTTGTGSAAHAAPDSQDVAEITETSTRADKQLRRRFSRKRGGWHLDMAVNGIAGLLPKV
jgi:hypothetical protein